MDWIQLALPKMQVAGCCAPGDELAVPMKWREFFRACRAAFLFTFLYDVMKAAIRSVLLVLHYGRTQANCWLLIAVLEKLFVTCRHCNNLCRLSKILLTAGIIFVMWRSVQMHRGLVKFQEEIISLVMQTAEHTDRQSSWLYRAASMTSNPL